MFDLTGRVALVTGSGTGPSAGTGAGIAAALAAQGATIVVNDFYEDRASETVSAIAAAGGRAVASLFDVTDYEAVGFGLRDAEAAVGPVDILVNNAGNAGLSQMEHVQFRDSDPADWAKPIDVNLTGVLNCVHHVLGGMCDRGWGRIVTISTGAALIGLRMGVATYAAGKGGAISFMRHVAIESARSGVTANTVALGFQQPRVTQHGAVYERAEKAVPVGRLGRASDVGAFVVYLASEEASWMTGQTFQLNGGGTTT